MDRATPIHRRHQRAKLDTLGRGFWDTWSPENISFVLGLYCSIAVVAIESAIWFDDWPDNLFGLRVPPPVAASLLLLALFNGWLIDRFLASMTPGESALPKGARRLRLLIAIVPVFGLHAFTFWKAYLTRRQSPDASLAFRLPVQTLDLTRKPGRPAAGARLQRLYRSGIFFLGMALGLLPLLAWAGWLVSTPFGSCRHAVILGSCALLHVFACALMMHTLRCSLRKSHVSGNRRMIYRAVPFLLLFAAPGVIVGLILYFWLTTARETLVWKLHARRTGRSRLPLWQSLQDSLHQRWQSLPWHQRWRQPTGLSNEMQEGRSDQEVTAFYRLKTLLLVLDGAAFVMICSQIVVRSTMIGAITLAGIGLLLQIMTLVARIPRLQGWAGGLTSRPYGRYLLLTQAAFLGGLAGAWLISEGQILSFSLFLSLGGLLCGVLTVIFFIPRASGFAVKDLLIWAALFFSWIALGLLIGLEGRGSGQALAVLGWLTVLTPLWSLGLVLALGGWLLRPFSWRHVFDRRLPVRSRWALASVILSAALPLGGLAIPFWIYARHRLWPRYERCLAAGGQRRAYSCRTV